MKEYKSRCNNWTHKNINKVHRDESKYYRSSNKLNLDRLIMEALEEIERG